MILCEYCNSKNYDNSLECHRCGAPLPLREHSEQESPEPLRIYKRDDDHYHTIGTSGSSGGAYWKARTANQSLRGEYEETSLWYNPSTHTLNLKNILAGE